MTGGLAAFNAADDAAARRTMLGCCASPSFALAMAEGRPYRDLAAFGARLEAVFSALTWADIEEAMKAHARIGEPAGAQSRAEQAGAASAAEDTRRALAEGNLAYEERFGHVFLICASGRGGEEMLAELRLRLRNDRASERAVVRRELLAITRLRTERVLAS